MTLLTCVGGHIKMAKIVYNDCYGGFRLSHQAVMRYAELKGITLYASPQFDIHTKVPWEEFVRVHEQGIKEKNYNLADDLCFAHEDIERTDPVLVQVLEELSLAASSGQSADLQIIEVPDGTLYRIEMHDGAETVRTRDDTDWKVAK
jgi:hypothetical protein